MFPARNHPVLVAAFVIDVVMFVIDFVSSLFLFSVLFGPLGVLGHPTKVVLLLFFDVARSRHRF